MLLSPANEAVARATAPVVAENAVQITSVFYPSMFAANPELLRTFNQGNQATGEQREALAASVVAYAGHLLDPRTDFGPILRRIAHKHVSLGITPHQYTIVGHHLMKAVAEVLGDAVTAEVAAAWDEVYWLFACNLVAEEARLYARAGITDPADYWRKYSIVERIEEADDTTTFVMTPVDGEVPEYEPGQYVSVAVDLPDGSRQPRQYTLSAAHRPDRMQITVRRVRGSGEAPDGAVSTFLHEQVHPGDQLDVGIPAGDMVLTESADPLLLVSAGVGITPVAAIIDQLATVGATRPVTLVHAERNSGRHALYEATTGKLDTLPGSAVHTFYEDLDELATERGARQGFADLSTVQVSPSTDVFLCGPLPFMRGARSALLRSGIETTRIRYEVFGPDLFASGDASAN